MKSSHSVVGGNRYADTILVFAAVVLLACSSSANAQTERVLFNFGTYAGDSTNPYAGIIADSAGNFYGTTFLGGAFDDGSVFEVSPPAVKGGAWTETVLYSFTGGSDGSLPQSGLVMDSQGALYGAADLGAVAGTVYKLTPPAISGDPWTETTIYSFTGGDDGGLPLSTLVFDNSGNLYGTTQGGGVYGGGTVFELSPPAISGDPWTETVLYSFDGSPFSHQYTHGCAPHAGVILGPKGALYGTTEFCGSADNGVVYKLAPPISGTNWIHSVLHTFTPSTGDGGRPHTSLVMNKSGILFGTTTFGGAEGEGTVFSVDPTSGAWIETVLYTFTGGADGGIPEGPPTLVPRGDIYGTTYNGGVHWGVIYKLTPSGSGWVESIPYTFTGGNDGGGPEDGVLLLNGILYGTTEFGGTVGFGTQGKGTVFSFIP
jgi:uncharacterized repeat protein (TIGR03803 family)